MNDLEIFRSFLEAFPDDRPTAVAMMHDDAVMSVPYAPDHFPESRFEGRAVFGPVMMMGTMYTDFRWTSLDCYQTNEPGLCIATASSEAKLSDGSPYRNRYVMIGRLRDGKIAEFTEFLDPRPTTAAIIRDWIHGRTKG